MEDAEIAGVFLKQDRFGYFEFEALGRKSRRCQRVGDDTYELAGPELEGRQIDCELEVLWPQAGIGARTPRDPFAERVDHADFLSQGNESIGWNDAVLGVSPAHQRLDGTGLSGRQVHNGLV